MTTKTPVPEPSSRYTADGSAKTVAASKKDTKYSDPARKLFEIAKSIDDFNKLKTEHGPEGQKLYQMFQANPPR